MRGIGRAALVAAIAAGVIMGGPAVAGRATGSSRAG